MTYAEAKREALTGRPVVRPGWCLNSAVTGVGGRLIYAATQELFYPTPQDIRAADWTAAPAGDVTL